MGDFHNVIYLFIIIVTNWQFDSLISLSYNISMISQA